MATNRRILIERVRDDLARVTIYRRYARDSWSEEKVDYMRDRHIPARLQLPRNRKAEVWDKREAF